MSPISPISHVPYFSVSQPKSFWSMLDLAVMARQVEVCLVMQESSSDTTERGLIVRQKSSTRKDSIQGATCKIQSAE